MRAAVSRGRSWTLTRSPPSGGWALREVSFFNAGDRDAQPMPGPFRNVSVGSLGATLEQAQRWLCKGAQALGRVVAPDYCAACDAPTYGVEPFCEECGPCSPASAPLPLGAVAAGAYAPPLSTAILRLKYGRRTDLADRLSVLLPEVGGADPGLVVPVPLHVERLVERGFNAPALLARGWCRRVGAEFAPWLLSRWRGTPHQSHLSREERARNVAGAFVAGAGAAGRQVILIDDVVTTGATLEACRAALYAAGVVHVTVVALAATSLARGWEASRARATHALQVPTTSRRPFPSLQRRR
jgi:ComF family protein